MNVEEVKVAPALKFKPNPYFDQVDIPYLYQKRASLIMYARPRMVLGDDVGLGKTIESIIAFSFMKSRQPGLKAIIFSEKSALLQWKREIEWISPNLKVALVTADTHPDPKDRRRALLSQTADIKITTYYTVYKYLVELTAGLGEEYAVFADECNYFKNSGTKMFEQMKTLCDGASRAYGMTATVIENRLDEAYCIFRVIAPGTIPSRKYFDQNFCITKRVTKPDGKTTSVQVGYKNIHRFRQMIDPVFYGRLQTDPEVEQDLPEDIHKDVPIMMSRSQSKKYIEAEGRIFQTADKTFVQLGMLSSLTTCQQMANAPALKGFDIPSAKEETLVEQLTNSLAGEKVIVYSKYRSQVDRIEFLLKAAGIDCGRITGLETQDQREAYRVRFQTPGENSLKVLLITKAGQKALNLQLARHIIMFDLPWSYGMYRQIIGRAKRTGSTHSHIGIYRYLAELHPDECVYHTSAHTIDHHVLAVLKRKKDLFNALLDDNTSIMTTEADLAEVYKSIFSSGGKTIDAV